MFLDVEEHEVGLSELLSLEGRFLKVLIILLNVAEINFAYSVYEICLVHC